LRHIIIGFTGSRFGMTTAQKLVVASFLDELQTSYNFVCLMHGDCTGADDQANRMAKEREFFTWALPPKVNRYRARSPSDLVSTPAAYLVRDRLIALGCHEGLACPATEKESRMSGTWYTIKEMKKLKKKVTIITPTGGLI
jgi:hypothetical protein